MKETTPNNSNRRAALKALAAATGAAGLAALPSRWSKPAVNVGAVPAHAQTSCSEWSLIVESLGLSGGAQSGFTTSRTEDLRQDEILYWDCTGRCFGVGFYVYNETGTFSFRVTIFGIPMDFSVTGTEEMWFILNPANLQWGSTTSVPSNSDWESIGCAVG